MSFWGKLLGSDKALETGAKIAHEATGGIINGIDAAFYTKEENVRDIKEVLLKLQDQFTPRSISRRVIAIIFTINFTIFAMTALAFACLKKFDIVKAIAEIAEAFSIGSIMLTIVVFYFGYYGLKNIMPDKK